MLHKKYVDELIDEAASNIPSFYKGDEPNGLNAITIFVGTDASNRRVPVCMERCDGDGARVVEYVLSEFKQKGVVAYVTVAEGKLTEDNIQQANMKMQPGEEVVIAYATDGFYSRQKLWKINRKEDSVELVEKEMDGMLMDGPLCHLLDGSLGRS